jgi:alpha-beta hydrolase superfamily lysophospholipase
MSEILRFRDWTDPVRPVAREVLSVVPDGGSDRHLLFVPGPGRTAQVFREHWLPHAAGRNFAAHALTPRAGGDLRAYAHDLIQVAASLPRQSVLVGHGTGALIVARALARYPARAAVLVSPMLDRWTIIGAALKANPAGALPAVFGGRLRLDRRQLGADPAGYRPAKLPSAGTLAPPAGQPPVLVVGSPDDRVVPRTALDRTAARYGNAPLLFPGMGHELMLADGWAEPLDAVLDWLEKEPATT